MAKFIVEGYVLFNVSVWKLPCSVAMRVEHITGIDLRTTYRGVDGQIRTLSRSNSDEK
jgi:hypothetical protein